MVTPVLLLRKAALLLLASLLRKPTLLTSFSLFFFIKKRSTKLPFHIDRRAMNSISLLKLLFLLISPSSWVTDDLLLVSGFSFHHLLLTVKSTTLDYGFAPRKGRDEESSAPVPMTNRTSLGPEFCEQPDRHHDDLHYVVRYIDPENSLFFRNPFCS